MCLQPAPAGYGAFMNTQEATQDRRSAATTARLIVGALLLAALIAVIVDNRRSVSVGYVVGDAEAPMFVVLVAAALAGAIIGWLFLHRRRRRL
jgi:uncharacterized integral membrane protein